MPAVLCAAQVLGLLPLVGLCSQHPNPALKLAAACCLAALAAAHTQPIMPHLLRLLTPLMAGKWREPMVG